MLQLHVRREDPSKMPKLVMQLNLMSWAVHPRLSLLDTCSILNTRDEAEGVAVEGEASMGRD